MTWLRARLPEDRRVRTVLAAVGVLVAWPIIAALLPKGAPIGVVFIGAVLGTVTALTAMGLILIYRTNRIINFAYIGMGGLGGVLAIELFLEVGRQLLPRHGARHRHRRAHRRGWWRCWSCGGSPTRRGCC